MTAAPRIDSYEWSGGREAMLRWGPEGGPVVVIALPLFEEANRTRAFAASICRALAGWSIGSVLPELPGQGESQRSTATVRLAQLRAAFAAVPGDVAVAIRSGALVIDDRPCWLLSPQTAGELTRELARIRGDLIEEEPAMIAGNRIDPALLDGLVTATHPGAGRGGSGASRTVRLTSDVRAADRHVDGPALWRRAEPDDNPALAQTLAADIADWIRACGG